MIEFMTELRLHTDWTDCSALPMCCWSFAGPPLFASFTASWRNTLWILHYMEIFFGVSHLMSSFHWLQVYYQLCGFSVMVFAITWLHISCVNLGVHSWIRCRVDLYVSCLGCLLPNVTLQVFEYGHKCICFVLISVVLSLFFNICIVQLNWACLTWKSAIEIKSLLLLLLMSVSLVEHSWNYSHGSILHHDKNKQVRLWHSCEIHTIVMLSFILWFSRNKSCWLTLFAAIALSTDRPFLHMAFVYLACLLYESILLNLIPRWLTLVVHSVNYPLQRLLASLCFVGW